MDIAKYSRDKLLEPKPFTPIAPDGKKLDDIKIYIISTKSDEGLEFYNRYLKEQGGSEPDLIKGREYDIELASLIIDRFEGVKIDGKELESTPENIKYLVTNFDFIRIQAINQAKEDAFFFSE